VSTVPDARRPRRRRLVVSGLALSLLAVPVALLAEDTFGGDFSTWLAALRDEALGRSISPATVESALTGIRPNDRVIELDRKQPEGTMTFERYLKTVVTKDRIRDGRRKLSRHRELLGRIRERYGVQPRFLVALWGVESNYGRRTGSFPVVEALATLAWDGRRGDFFRGELLDALHILDEGHIEPERMLGSWAGAMGQPQFIPSSFRRYAVDFDGDSRRDIWGSPADVLASAANYLSTEGWRDDLIWGREARLPEGFEHGLIGGETGRPLSEWQQLGVRRADGSDLPRADLRAALVRPGGTSGPVYLTYDNYRVLLRWNRSDYFATAVSLLSDRIAGR
jgi:membrane-bound lytic murein transglycosylase B